MKINKELVIELANDLKFSLNSKEINEIVETEIEISTRMLKIEYFEIEGDVEPLNFPFPIENNYLREDKEITTISREEGLQNTKNTSDNFVTLPRVVK